MQGATQTHQMITSTLMKSIRKFINCRRIRLIKLLRKDKLKKTPYSVKYEHGPLFLLHNFTLGSKQAV